ncbi:transposable element Tc3 transposase [Trichonephila clavipes]|nr:transposable element Tc3 transposase [Trichonephila clavipes]
MITNFFIPELNNQDVQELWFQQDGATCHTARATIDLLKDPFGDRLISRFGPVNWPPRSCDLTPLDYFLWGYVKSLVYVDKPQTLDHFEDNIRRVIADIRPQMLEKVIENWMSRLDYIRASRGNHMPEIIFKILTTATYGTKSAPYLDTRSLKQLAVNDGDKYPLAADVIMSGACMNDLFTGADDLESGRKLQEQLVSLLKGAGMELHKWSASNPLLLPDSMYQDKDLSSSSTDTKTLGFL